MGKTCFLTTIIECKSHLVNRHYFFKMSPNFAEFLLENADTAADVLAVLDDIVEVVETGGTDL